jgi:MATE family multidrug resistance protein
MVLSPLISVWAFTYDGIFIGRDWTRPMRNSAIAGSAACGLAAFLLQEPFGSMGYGRPFLLFLGVRGQRLAAALRGRIDAAVA